MKLVWNKKQEKFTGGGFSWKESETSLGFLGLEQNVHVQIWQMTSWAADRKRSCWELEASCPGNSLGKHCRAQTVVPCRLPFMCVYDFSLKICPYMPSPWILPYCIFAACLHVIRRMIEYCHWNLYNETAKCWLKDLLPPTLLKGLYMRARTGVSPLCNGYWFFKKYRPDVSAQKEMLKLE